MTATLETTEVHPTWCQGVDCYDLLGLGLHATPPIVRGRAMVEIVQEVQWRGGVTITLPMHIEVSYDGNQIFNNREGLTVEDCREFAAVLLAAADQLDLLNTSDAA